MATEVIERAFSQNGDNWTTVLIGDFYAPVTSLCSNMLRSSFVRVSMTFYTAKSISQPYHFRMQTLEGLRIYRHPDHVALCKNQTFWNRIKVTIIISNIEALNAVLSRITAPRTRYPAAPTTPASATIPSSIHVSIKVGSFLPASKTPV